MKILISGKPWRGRLAKCISDVLVSSGFRDIDWTGDIFDEANMSKLDGVDVFIACAWNTGPGYKTSESNLDYARITRKWLLRCHELGVRSIYLGTSNFSGFGDCLYKICKDSCDSYANHTIKIPFVWQPEREGSLAYKVSNGIPFDLVDSDVVYVTEKDVAEEVLCEVRWYDHFMWIAGSSDVYADDSRNYHDLDVVDMSIGPGVKRRMLSEWIDEFRKSGK